MREWLSGIATFLLCMGATASAASADCGPVPNVKCLATEIFSLAKTLPADHFFRPHVAFAERELAPGDIKTALDYVVSDNPDPSPWEDIEWIALAGQVDRAIKQARERSLPVERLGGLLAVATNLLDKNDTARATKIVEEVERELPSIKADENDQDAASLPRDAGEIRARLGQTERAARLIGGSGINSVSTFLALASQYPMAVSLREQAWREAERAKEPYAWQLVVEDAIGRGDQAEALRAAQRAGNAIDGTIDGDHPELAISLARVLLTAGSSDLAAKLVKPWPQWINAREGIDHPNIVNALIPVLAGLARDQDVKNAIRAVSNPFHHSSCLAKAAEEYVRLGRNDIAEKFDAEALAVVVASPTREPKQQWDHDAALSNLALSRAGRGDIDGALIVAAKLRDEVKVREATSYVVKRAIDVGYGSAAGPAIETLEQRAIAAQEARSLLVVAKAWYDTGSEDKARNSLSQALNLVDTGAPPLDGNDIGLAAELMWRLDGAEKAEAMIAIVDKIGATDPSAIDHLVEIIRPVSPAVAVQLAGRQVEVWRRIVELANIGIQIAENAKAPSAGRRGISLPPQ